MGFAELMTILLTLTASVAILFAIDSMLRIKTQKNNAAAVLKDFGLYDVTQDIFYLAIDDRQRKYGYCLWYDENATYNDIVADSEPIRFEYEGKKWLIELWKGQYGVFTAGEIGVYTTIDCSMAIPYDKTIYSETNADDHLRMEFKLIKDEKILFQRKDTHWRLSGFIPGIFSEPNELTMEVKIIFKSIEMRRRFTEALTRMGYTYGDYYITNRSVRLTFKTPHIFKLKSSPEIQARNMDLCMQYSEISDSFNNSLEKLAYIKSSHPKLYRRLLRPRHKRIKKLGLRSFLCCIDS